MVTVDGRTDGGRDEYTGEVTSGGDADVRVLDTLIIRKASVGPMDNNAYLLTCRCSGAQLLIDAAADPERLMRLVREGSRTGRLDTIVTTHAHHDHVGALGALVKATGARTAAGAEDAPAIRVPTRMLLRDGDVVRVGVHDLEVIALHGHTEGSIALAYRGEYYGDHIFTGDSLFPGGVGATHGDPERFTTLLGDVTRKIFDRFDDSTWIYPGHGPDTTLGAERSQLATWRERGW